VSVSANGTPTTTLTLTFDKVVPGLSVANITLSMPSTNMFGANKGSLSNVGPVYTLGVGAVLDGTVTVRVAGDLLQITDSPKTVDIRGDGGASLPTLVAGTWVDGTIAAGIAADWYKFTAIEGTTYTIWWNGGFSNYGDGTKNLDVKGSAYYASGTSIFTGVNQGWTTPAATQRTFTVTAATAGTIFVKIAPYYDNNTGTYGVTYSTGNTRP
jgi:hypothetical protein